VCFRGISDEIPGRIAPTRGRHPSSNWRLILVTINSAVYPADPDTTQGDMSRYSDKPFGSEKAGAFCSKKKVHQGRSGERELLESDYTHQKHERKDVFPPSSVFLTCLLLGGGSLQISGSIQSGGSPFSLSPKFILVQEKGSVKGPPFSFSF